MFSRIAKKTFVVLTVQVCRMDPKNDGCIGCSGRLEKLDPKENLVATNIRLLVSAETRFYLKTRKRFNSCE